MVARRARRHPPTCAPTRRRKYGACFTESGGVIWSASISTEGVPGRRYRHLWVEAEDSDGNPARAVTYIADGNPIDGNPSLRYLTLMRDGARAHGLPEDWVRFLENVKAAT